MKITQPGSHADHLLRQTRMDHMQLSSMADVKANMLLTVASVVITLTIPHTLDPGLKWPVIVLIGFCLSTIVLAIYAAMPKIPTLSRPDSRPDINSPNFNLLFFANFASLRYEEYATAMEKVLSDPSLSYEVQVRQIYDTGRFLRSRKYRYVQLAYLTFMGGLLVSSLMLFIAVIRG